MSKHALPDAVLPTAKRVDPPQTCGVCSGDTSQLTCVDGWMDTRTHRVSHNACMTPPNMFRVGVFPTTPPSSTPLYQYKRVALKGRAADTSSVIVLVDPALKPAKQSPFHHDEEFEDAGTWDWQTARNTNNLPRRSVATSVSIGLALRCALSRCYKCDLHDVATHFEGESGGPMYCYEHRPRKHKCSQCGHEDVLTDDDD